MPRYAAATMDRRSSKTYQEKLHQIYGKYGSLLPWLVLMPEFNSIFYFPDGMIVTGLPSVQSKA